MSRKCELGITLNNLQSIALGLGPLTKFTMRSDQNPANGSTGLVDRQGLLALNDRTFIITSHSIDKTGIPFVPQWM